MRPGAAVLERFGGDLVTRSQLDMIARGLDGDGSAAAIDLDLEPRALSHARVRQVARTVAPFPSVRIWPSQGHRAFARLAGRAGPALAWFVPLALAAMLIAPRLLPSVWGRMAVVEAVLAAVAVVAVPLPWRRLLRPRLWHVPVGLAAAAVMYVGGALVFAGLGAVWPAAVDQTRAVLAWTNEIPRFAQLPALLFIVAAEDIVWRAAVTLPLAARAGPVVGALLAASAFALGHVTSGPPVLWVAALVAGFAWSVLLLRARSLWPIVICHASWDIAVAYVRPYV
jgi:membrane protease YdiL (CAAX protease family)